ncbi:hypothetical protein MIR68_011481 [Amoeboaphelidium protococcarum]|nr:hypothetical protein MIR68_011481 [Amoeboaphelidium protococcarum]
MASFGIRLYLLIGAQTLVLSCPFLCIPLPVSFTLASAFIWLVYPLARAPEYHPFNCTLQSSAVSSVGIFPFSLSVCLHLAGILYLRLHLSLCLCWYPLPLSVCLSAGVPVPRWITLDVEQQWQLNFNSFSFKHAIFELCFIFLYISVYLDQSASFNYTVPKSKQSSFTFGLSSSASPLLRNQLETESDSTGHMLHRIYFAAHKNRVYSIKIHSGDNVGECSRG